nr:MgtC/SapB family protein [Bradyrhizobium sp. UFLA03-84]
MNPGQSSSPARQKGLRLLCGHGPDAAPARYLDGRRLHRRWHDPQEGDPVTGVTTAATLWLITVIGLCLGGGQLALGCVATPIGVCTLSGLKWVDVKLPRRHRATLTVTYEADIGVIDALPNLIKSLHYRGRFQEQRRREGSAEADYVFEVWWQRPEDAPSPVDLLRTIEKQFTIRSFELTTENGR